VAYQGTAIAAALDMAPAERRRRIEGIRRKVREYDVTAWIETQLEDVDRLATRRLSALEH
jgi:trehalose-6-phosphate synthase